MSIWDCKLVLILFLCFKDKVKYEFVKGRINVIVNKYRN